MKVTEKASDTYIRRGMESAPVASLRKGVISTGYYNKSKISRL